MRPRPRGNAEPSAASGSNPMPSSSMVTRSVFVSRCRYTRHELACACLATLVRASWMMRNAAVSVSDCSRSLHPLLEQLHSQTVALAESVQVRLDGGRQPEIVEQRRMQQMREVPHRLKHAFGDRSGVIEGIGGSAGAFNGSLCDGEFDFDRRQRLADCKDRKQLRRTVRRPVNCSPRSASSNCMPFFSRKLLTAIWCATSAFA